MFPSSKTIIASYAIFRIGRQFCNGPYLNANSLNLGDYLIPILVGSYLTARYIKSANIISTKALWLVANLVCLSVFAALAIFALCVSLNQEMHPYPFLFYAVLSGFVFTPFFVLAMKSESNENQWLKTFSQLGYSVAPFLVMLVLYEVGFPYLMEEGLGSHGD
jgi:cytochrome bd-type quinol oxidase subunit 2